MRWEACDTPEQAWDVLLAFADTVLFERFSAIDDLVSRVLGGGVANRYQTRLVPTAKWMADRERKPEDDEKEELLLTSCKLNAPPVNANTYS